MTRQTSALVGALALGTCLLMMGQVFVPSALGSAAASPAPSLRGGSIGASIVTYSADSAESGTTPGMAMVGLIGTVALFAFAHPRNKAPQIVCQAEPISAAAAAAAAAKAGGAVKAASAAAGAAKTAGAVAGSAGTGSLVKDAPSQFDDELAKKKFFPQDRGTPEYEAYMKQLREAKERAWAQRTRRNPDGTFGSANDAKVSPDDAYDPFTMAESNWLDNAAEAGLYAGEFDPAYQVGVTGPLGYFDPLGFCKMGDKVGFSNLRAAEIKHGRVAMMAALGGVVQHYVQFPGFKDVPKGLAAVNTPPGSYGAIALFAIAGVLELVIWRERNDTEPGNFGDPVGFDQYTEEFRNRELNNGRFAMFAAMGIIAAELLTGKDAIEQFGL